MRNKPVVIIGLSVVVVISVLTLSDLNILNEGEQIKEDVYKESIEQNLARINFMIEKCQERYVEQVLEDCLQVMEKAKQDMVGALTV